MQWQRAISLAAAVVALALPVGAAEQATLTNGFTLRCDHHALVDGHVRLYLSAGESNFIALPPNDIQSIARLPDPPQPQAAAAHPAAIDANLSKADLHEMLAEAGQTHNLDVDLLASVVKAESGGNARAVSPAGARGLMQLMPATATDLGVADTFQPNENVRGGSAYLDALLTRYHDSLALALAAYNAGPTAVDKYHGIPPYRETRAYVARVIHEFNRRVLAREARQRQVSASAASLPH